MPSHHRFISEWSSEKFIAWAGHIGENCKVYRQDTGQETTPRTVL